MSEHGLQLAITIAEIVLLIHRRVSTDIDVNIIGGNPQMIQTESSVMFLGILLDKKLSFWEQFQRPCEKAASVAFSLSRLIATGKQRFLMSMVNSILLYRSEIWADAT